MEIISFAPFGYEGSLVTVDVDLRRGIPAVDIVGLADSEVKESRTCVMSAIRNSGFEFPAERVLIGLSPADIKKNGRKFDLPMALAILKENNAEAFKHLKAEKVFVIGGLCLDGKVQDVNGVYAALQSAKNNGIKYAIIPASSTYSETFDVPSGINVRQVRTLKEAFEALANIDREPAVIPYNGTETLDFGSYNEEPNLDSVKGNNGLKYAMAVAAAGGHHLLAYGAPGCGKSMTLQHFPELLPKLTPEERLSVDRLSSLAGLSCTKGFRPFRQPHQSASIEGICGGGVNCLPGEISLAHNGVLFLDEASEFKSSVLQMLRVPMESKTITLSRAGRTTVYPANFQLVMATSPCPCGMYGVKDRVCLCSSHSIELFWKKFPGPLLDRIAIRYNCNEEDTMTRYTLAELREMVEKARNIQYARQGKLNQDLTPQEVADYIKTTDGVKSELERLNLNTRTVSNILKLARTLADMTDLEETEVITERHLDMALKIHGHSPEIVEGMKF